LARRARGRAFIAVTSVFSEGTSGAGHRRFHSRPFWD
jgi:hypothetical protein